MGKNRLEAFSDGVIAIIITIMVLELKVPHEATFAALAPLWSVLLSYVLGFVYVGIYWNNHHRMLAAYGVVLLMAAIAYWLLQQKLIALDGPDSTLKRAVGGDWKGKLSPLFYITGIVASFWQPWIAEALYVTVALIWLVPDRRIEATMSRAA